MFIQNILAKLADSEADTPQLFSAVYTKRYIMKKVASRCPLDASTGRSMVEMLGVLAIIGVLSVGAIAGYSKAMMKYKLNQHAQAVGMLINNVLSIKDRLQHNKTGETYYGTLLHKMNLIPDGIKYINNDSLHDTWFNGDMWVYYNNDYDVGGIGFQFDSSSSFGAEVCRNIVITSKENAGNLRLIILQKSDLNNNVDYTGALYGDTYCQEGKNAYVIWI